MRDLLRQALLRLWMLRGAPGQQAWRPVPPSQGRLGVLAMREVDLPSKEL